jgi:hypothetical protein
MSAAACRVNKIDFEEVTVDLFKSQNLTPEFKSTPFPPFVTVLMLI